MHFRWDNASLVSEAVWRMRLADLPRGDNRTIIQQLFNGDPPFDPALAEENNIEVNRNDLSGPNLLSQARRQWNTAFQTTENYFGVTLDSGPDHKRGEWARIITREANRVLKPQRRMLEQSRATGGMCMLHGAGLTMWDSRAAVIPKPVPMCSVMIPSETDLDFENLAYFAIFREWTPAQLMDMTQGPRVDPGWNQPLVKSQWKYVREQIQKQPNATAFQYMPERIEELSKQDMGFWGSDAVPTIDAWDFYFRDDEDGKGWYRRTVLDWGITDTSYSDGKYANTAQPKFENPDAEGKFLYTSGTRKYAKSLSEIMHANFIDCSCYFPAKYHSIRSLGWMLWGVCDLQNRLHCKFNEAVFEQLMWFFRTANNEQLIRLKKANFTHLGVIPAGIEWIKAQDRFTPDMPLLQMAFTRNQGQMNNSAASYNQQFDQSPGQREMTATETMARVNQVNALVSGTIALAYNYEDYKYMEMARRLCITSRPHPLAAKFQLQCLKQGVPPEMLDSERWRVQSDKTMGAGNKTLALAQANFLQQVRPNLGPDAQRTIDHISIEVNTDDSALAEELAPLQGQQQISASMHDAQLYTDRIMRLLPVVLRKDMVLEDYVITWLADLELMLQQAQQTNMAKPEDIMGWDNMVKEIDGFLKLMPQDQANGPKIRQYNDRLGQAVNLIKGFAQRLQEQMQAGNGNGAGPTPEQMAEIQAEELKTKQKLEQQQASHSQRTAQRQVQFELEQQRKEQETNADIRRENAVAANKIAMDTLTPKPNTE